MTLHQRLYSCMAIWIHHGNECGVYMVSPAEFGVDGELAWLPCATTLAAVTAVLAAYMLASSWNFPMFFLYRIRLFPNQLDTCPQKHCQDMCFPTLCPLEPSAYKSWWTIQNKQVLRWTMTHYIMQQSCVVHKYVQYSIQKFGVW